MCGWLQIKLSSLCLAPFIKLMILFEGDEVRLKSGEIAEVIEIWGVARVWCKLKTRDGKVSFSMVDNIESIVRSKRRSRRKK